MHQLMGLMPSASALKVAGFDWTGDFAAVDLIAVPLRIIAPYRGWEERITSKPEGVHVHDDPLLLDLELKEPVNVG
jgi:hypothetical protein